MSTQYTITITNNSGSDQNYCLFNEAPIISNVVQSEMWLNVFKKRTIPNGDSGKFVIARTFGAVCGTADKKPSEGVTVSVGGSQVAKLGLADDNGSLKTPGSTFTVAVASDTPRFSKDPQTDGGAINSFEIRTGDIDFNEAQNGGWLIGLAGSLDGTGLDGPAATFCPQGNKSYQIQPVVKYYISTNDYAESSLIKVSSVQASPASVDFGSRTDRTVKFVHNNKGKIVMQT